MLVSQQRFLNEEEIIKLSVLTKTSENLVNQSQTLQIAKLKVSVCDQLLGLIYNEENVFDFLKAFEQNMSNNFNNAN